jgi:hypothetical protein
MLVAYNLLTQEKNSVLDFFHRGDQDEHVIGTSDLAARVSGTQPQFRPAQFEVSDSRNLPSEVNVDHPDPTIDYQTGSQRERVLASGVVPAENVERVTLPTVMAPERARGVARRLLWTAIAERTVVRLSLPPSYYGILEGDIVTFVFGGVTESIRVRRVGFGANRILEVEGVLQDDAAFSQIEEGEAGHIGPGTTPQVPSLLDWHVFNLAPLTQDRVPLFGVYFSVSALTTSFDFLGGEMFEATVIDGEYSERGSIVESIMGRAQTVLARGPLGRWDRINTVRVKLNNAFTLSSKTEQEVYSGANRAMLGEELIAFKTATLVSTGVYDLSMLLRGLRGTEKEVGGHFAGDRFIVIDSDIGFFALDLSAVGQTRYTKAVSVGAEPADVAAKAYAFSNTIQRPFPPHVYSTRRYEDLTSQRIELKWHDRSRYPFTLLGLNPVSLDVENRYEVYIWDITNSEWDLLSTSATTSLSVAYSQWSTRGYGGEDAVFFKLRRLGDYGSSDFVYIKVWWPNDWYDVPSVPDPGPDPVVIQFENFGETTE